MSDARNQHNRLTDFRSFEQQPSADLRHTVRRFMVVEFADAEVYEDWHLPDTEPVIAISLRGECRIDGSRTVPRAAFSGVRETLRRHQHCNAHTVLLATCHPSGASALLGAPMDSLRGQTVDFADAPNAPRGITLLHEELAEQPDWSSRITVFEHFLRSRARSLEPDPIVTMAAAWLKQHPSATRIAKLAQYVGLSQSAFERRFRRGVGVPPKTFARILQLRHAVGLLSAGSSSADAALQAGYFDQSHFISAFRRATGLSPTRLLSSQSKSSAPNFSKTR